MVLPMLVLIPVDFAATRDKLVKLPVWLDTGLTEKCPDDPVRDAE